MEAWPTNVLPKPTRSLQVARISALTRTSFDDGIQRQRRRFTEHRDSFRVVWQMSDFQYEFFRGWFKEKIEEGAAWFTMDMPNGGGYQNQTIRVVSGRYNSRHKTNGVFDWEISVVIEVNNSADITEELIDWLALNGLDSVYEMERVYSLLHETPFTGTFHLPHR